MQCLQDMILFISRDGFCTFFVIVLINGVELADFTLI